MTGLFWLTALAGGLGAALRLLADGAVRERWGSYLPWGTWVVNLTGSFALGLLVGLAQRWLAPEWLSVLGTGVMGGFTTFSTASVETVRLLEGRRYAAALGVGVGMLAAALIAAASGYWLGGQ
ncbi:MAG: CrcB family protein [Micropruina sp.]|nr:CrcB family protein [Micropruina sp.]